MANMTDYLENKLLDSILGVSAYTFPATTYLALFTGDPTDTGDVSTEVSGGAYTRMSLNTIFSAATGTTGTSSNTSIITFPTATASWGTISHVGFMETGTPTTADMLLHSTMALAKPIDTDDIISFAVGNLTLVLA